MKLQVDSLSNQAYDILKQKIISQELKPGMRLVDSLLAEEFGISRTPLRDAIRKLVEEGLVTPFGKRGFCVFKPSKQDIIEIFEIREMIDKATVQKLIEEVLPGNPKAMQKLRQMYTQMTNEVDDKDFVQVDEDFHDQLVLLTGNARLFSIFSDNRNQTRLFRGVTSSLAERRANAMNFHERICLGLLQLDLKATLQAVTEHIEQSRKNSLLDFPD